MKTRLFTLIALSMLSSVPAFAMRESEGPQVFRRWMVARAEANVSEDTQKKESSELSGRTLSSDESKKANEEKTSVQETEVIKDTKEEVRARRPFFHHVGMGER